MTYLTLECPHCKAEKIGFAGRIAFPRRPGENEAILVLQCEGCGEAIVANVHITSGMVQQWISGHRGDPGPIWRLLPQAAAPKAPADTPPNVMRAFLSGVDNLGRQNGANAAVAMFRRAIELAVKGIDPDAPKGMNLKGRIERLPDNVATPAMKEWAHHIRLEANDAVHEEEDYSDKDARDLHTFAELFLTYAFTLPEMLKKAKETPAA